MAMRVVRRAIAAMTHFIDEAADGTRFALMSPP